MVQPKEPTALDRKFAALGRTLQTLREEENADVLIQTVLHYLQSEFVYGLIWIGLYDRLGHQLIGKGGSTVAGELPQLRQRFPLSPGDLLEQVVIQPRPLTVPDLREELRVGEWRKVAQAQSIQGTIIFPIRYKDRCYGVALLGTGLWGATPKPDEKARLSMVLGGLGAALFQIEAEWQRQQTKRPDRPLLSLLGRLQALTGLGARLEAIIEETHQFIQPSRTNVYWFERERRYFWRRLGNHQLSAGHDNHQPASGITVQEVGSFYQALASDQVVAIGEAQSSLKADTTSRLMQQIRARSLLAAPILFQNELLGFLAVEGTEPRIWLEEEKSYLRGAAQVISLTAPLNEMESTIEHVKLDQAITAEIARSIYNEEAWKETLKLAADQVCKRLRAERFLVLIYDNDLGRFDLCYQCQPSNRRPVTAPLAPLDDADWKRLHNSTEPIELENLDGDVRFRVWRDRWLEVGIRSVLICNTVLGQFPEGLVLVCHETPRTWERVERDLVRVVSQQIGLMLHQWQLQKQVDQQQKINQTIQWGLTTIQQIHDLNTLEQSALHYLSQSLQVPLAALITWTPGQVTGRITMAGNPHDRFTLNLEAEIPIQSDPLICWALENDELLELTIADIPATTRQWLSGAGIGQLLVMALRTSPDHEPTGVLLIADADDRRWSERHLNALGTLVSQIAWSRRHLMLIQLLSSQRTELERLNWYKHRRLEEIYRISAQGLKRLNDLTNPKDPLFLTRQQQILRQLADAIAPLPSLLQAEHWQLRAEAQAIPLVTLLKRSLERVDWLIKQRQLWSQVHNDANPTITSDIPKLELVLNELLLAACQRSEPGGRIDFWCRQLDDCWLELSITDNGRIDSRLLNDLETGRSLDLLTPTLIDRPPGLHLLICQSVVQQIGCELHLFKLEDGRVLSRLVLPLSSVNEA
jgi:GAF domain-containing protein